MASVVKTTFQLKRGTAATWIRLNPVLAIGEPGYETDTGALKIGNGTTAWVDLPYLSANESGQLIASIQKTISEMQAQLGNIEGDLTIAERLSQIENNYLTKDTIQTIEQAIEDAKAEAINEALAQIVGENVDAKFDTLQEIAKWIEADSTESATLVIRLTDVEKKVAALEQAPTAVNTMKYEFYNCPEGSMVDYREKEVRLFCAENTGWTQQSVGDTGDPNYYYVGFKAYAPNSSVVSFKEDTKETITDNTMHYFENNSYAGIDEYGRKYSIIWLPVAKYDSATSTWTYLGEKSTHQKYIGWYYSVEWYNAKGEKIHADTIRINLTNKNCHTTVEPYYLGSININKLVQDEGDVLILNGGDIEN